MTGRLALRDGSVVAIRPLEQGDRAQLGAAIMCLSERSRYLRFASPMPVLRASDLDRLVDVDHVHREALLAIDPATRIGVAVARYAEMPEEPAVADVAVTVADEWQGRGLGSLLLAQVILRGRENGYRALRATTLAENRRSRALVKGAGFAVRSRDGVLIEYERALALPSHSHLT